jgi:hypothetical protein
VHPGLSTLTPVSRFIACMALLVVEQAGRYGAMIDTDVDHALEVVARRFTRLGFAEVPYPPAPARLFGGDDVILVATSDSVCFSAPNTNGFALAVEAFAGVRWKAPSVDEAHRGPYREVRAERERVSELLRAAAKAAKSTAPRRDGAS